MKGVYAMATSLKISEKEFSTFGEKIEKMNPEIIYLRKIVKDKN